ncbi:hypothetical protein CS0771_01090 [Catellatospora sp. IY07-71]|uniref:hypothetical protein n=1 Tax=Catellatospora sp. IY07-71 TaxID=2728827 RepID=UPI001BB3F095|nr:hypothetical protein [Catellatospora sp. IY07-71]BCJ70565.1 hypothetical protein CS0771_01090 [Catellatospora sp. IY07-71]
MPIESAALAKELALLCKGRAMLHPVLRERLGPQARAAFGIEDADQPPAVRSKVRSCVRRLLHDEELQKAALAALALLPRADQGLLKDRETAFARMRSFEARTARRRMRRAIRELVDALAEEHHGRSAPGVRCDDDGIVVRTFHARMRLDAAQPRLYERRTVEVTVDRLDRIAVRLTVPQPEPDAAESDVEICGGFGGEVGELRRTSPVDFEWTLRLPRTLRLGDTHEYGVDFTIPPGRRMRPHYVFQPLVPCERFELEVRFDPARLPEHVWLIDGLMLRALDHQQAQPERLVPDGRGAVQRTFTNLRQGMVYGVRWAPAAS